MKDTIFGRISMVENFATKQEKVIIAYIKKHSVYDITLMSITEFSEAAGVSDATVLRFCRKMSLRGYSEFRFLLSQGEPNEKGTEEDVARQSVADMINALNSTYERLDKKQIAKAADILLGAGSLYALGSGNSGLAAQEFRNKILRYGVKCNFYADSHFQAIATSLLEKTDAMILFSVSGGTKDMLALAKAASSQGVKLVIVTNYLKSPLAKYADALLHVVGKSAPLESGSLVIKVSQLYVIDVLCKEIYGQMGASAQEKLKKTAIAVMGKEV